MRPSLTSLVLFVAIITSASAHADLLDQFTLTGDGHTFVFALPSPFSFPDQFHLVTIPTPSTTGTVDGSPGYTFETSFASDLGTPLALGLFAFNLTPGTPDYAYNLDGSPLILFSGQSTIGNQVFDNGSFTPGTFSLIDYPSIYPGTPIDFQLTIAPQTSPSPVPEPSALVLIGTGSLALLSRLRHRRPRPIA